MHPLRIQRHLHGLTQVDLAKISGVSARTICSIEAPPWPGYRPRRDVCRRLTRALDFRDTEWRELFPEWANEKEV